MLKIGGVTNAFFKRTDPGFVSAEYKMNGQTGEVTLTFDINVIDGKEINHAIQVYDGHGTIHYPSQTRRVNKGLVIREMMDRFLKHTGDFYELNALLEEANEIRKSLLSDFLNLKKNYEENTSRLPFDNA